MFTFRNKLLSLCLSSSSVFPVRSITTCQSPLFQIRKNPTPVVHVAHDIHAVIQWVPPEKMKHWDPQRTGDLKGIPPINPNWLKLEYRPFADVIATLPEDHRKLFTVGLGHRRDGVNVIMENTLSRVRRHDYDKSSYEVIVAYQTIKIRNYQYHMQQEGRLGINNRKSKEGRVGLMNAICSRKKHLQKLRMTDYKRFEWIIQVLSILYRPSPRLNVQIKRRECFSRLTDMYCEDIIKRKMDIYKAELEGQKFPFLQEKLDTLLKIKEDEDRMRIHCSVEDEIADTRKRLEAFNTGILDITPASSNQLTS